MPTIGIFHTNYWEFSDTVVPPPPSTVAGGYPAWQAGVITPSLVGIVGAWIDARMALLKWHWRFARGGHGVPKGTRGGVVFPPHPPQIPLSPKGPTRLTE